MALRIEKRTGALVIALALSAPAIFAQELRYDVWHGQSRLVHLPPHAKKVGQTGTLTVSPTGISFDETYPEGKKPKHPRSWHWDYDDIQQLKIAPKSLSVLTYADNKWKLGADRQYDFDLTADQTFTAAYDLLKDKLDQRFVAEVPDKVEDALWDIPVKHLLRFRGDQGMLQVGPDRIVYTSQDERDSRTWRFEDIDNISSSGPFQLTITTFERAKSQYGDRKGFNFQLKRPLDEARYNDLWLRLNRTKGLQILNSYTEQ